MNKKAMLAAVMNLFITTSVAVAHDGVKHSGSPIRGKVASLADNTLVLSTEKGNVTVTLEPSTKYELGMDGTKAAPSDLKEGDLVMVEGTKLSSKEVSASEVMIYKAESESHKEREK